MTWMGVVAATALIVTVFIDTFEVMILPRRVRRSFRLARLFYTSTWVVWRSIARFLPAGRQRNAFLSVFGPLSLFGLMVVWATGLMAGFALLHWSLGTTLTFIHKADESFVAYLYFSGTTFITLGYGDIVPLDTLGRALSVAEAGIGFGFLAIVISYLPILYQAFSRREIIISLLDARAGSPPSASELIRRLAESHAIASVSPLLVDWERWSAELLESHLSYPVLRYYRSQHDNQSWVGALTTILDTSALIIAGNAGSESYQARLTFAMARHAAVDLSIISQTMPIPTTQDRLPAKSFSHIYQSLHEAGLEMRDGPAMENVLTELRGLYEPVVNALAEYFMFVLPVFHPDKPMVDNWQTSPWMRRSPGLGKLSKATLDDHFD